MKPLLVIICSALLSHHSIGQKKCNLNSLPQTAEVELLSFWKIFQESVTQKDSAKLISLCEFPFRVTAEILSNKRDIGENYQLTSNNLMQYSSLLFFEKQFSLSLANCNRPNNCLVLHGDLNKKHRSCVYEFFYTVQDKEGKDQIRSFQIVRIDSSYKLTANWIRY